MTTWKHLFIVNILGLACALVLSVSSITSSQTIEQELRNFDGKIMTRQIALRDMMSSIGYGGVIHSFKNYILRQDVRYIEVFERSVDRARQAISDYSATGELSEEESLGLNEIENMLLSYESSLDRVRTFNQTAEERDQLAAVNDTSYLQGIDRLQAALKKEHDAMSQKIRSRTDAGERAALVAGVASVLLIGGLGTMLVVRLSRQISKYSQSLEHEIKLKDDANRAKSEFLANMSHEIRTPMTAILGFLDALGDIVSRDKATKEAVEMVSIIRSNAGHLMTVINDVLDVSKIEAGKLTIELLEVDPILIVEESISLLKPIADEKGLSLEAKFDGQVPARILSDSVRLKQVLVNVLGNAIKFTDSGEVVIEVSSHQSAENNRTFLSYRVRDTGIGMSPEQVEVVARFNAFQQADASMSRRFGGTGLGLRISAALCEMLGGELAVESELGVGSVFTITIDGGETSALEDISGQKKRVVQVLPRIGEMPTESSCEKGHRLEGRSVLLVEDGVDNQRLISFFLRKEGADVAIASDGQQGVECFRAQPDKFDFVLMDMQMPIMDGYTAASLLRSEGYKKPIIAITAHAMTSDREKCYQAGCDGYLSKPIDRERFIAACTQAAAA